jgi:hypothetical protein
MKKFVLFLLMYAAGQAVQSQDLIIKYQFKTPEEKTRNAMEKLKSYKLSTDAHEKTVKVIGEFYKQQQKMLDGAVKNGVANVEAYKAKKAKLALERDDKLKKIFSKEQFANWVTIIEPSLSPKRSQNTAAVKG